MDLVLNNLQRLICHKTNQICNIDNLQNYVAVYLQKNWYDVLSMTLKDTCWLGFCSGALGSVESSLYCYYSQVHCLGVVVLVRISSMGQIELFENYLYWIGICESL